MKILLYFESEELIKTSGIGRAFKHQQAALTSANVEFTTNPNSTDYDILHINTYGLNSEIMIKQARKLGKKIIYHAHSTEEDFKNSFILSNQIAPIFKKLIVSLYTQADAIITPTPYSKALLESYGINLPIYPISNGIELPKYAYDEEKVKAYRRYFRIKEQEKVVISVGLYFERKGILDFIEVAKKMPDYKFIWFGHTPLVSIPKKIQDIIADHPANVYFPGYVKGPIIEGAYLDASCFFFPSLEETEGIVVLEALASKQNVIVRDIGVFDPWLVDKQDCYKGKNVDEFVALIDGVCNKRLPSTSENGYKVAMSKDIALIGEELKEVYTKVLAMD
ncbi:MAG: glycosyltransferase family 4 protein [Erysipelotrichaceae bacterium]|nr:glycosyltransferase family 4 protein [Erysipelotrichaceae bacterium]MDY5252227.1 glycosyltransferase family 4 protein [Erysipelotrichaceae bacterium]